MAWFEPRRSKGLVEAEARVMNANRARSSRLDLSNLDLARLPDSLASLQGLQWIDLSKNQLRDLPLWFGRFTRLQALNLSYNLLERLPECIRLLEQLRLLIVSENVISELPEWLSELEELQVLYANTNRLEQLPEAIGKLPALQLVDFAQNNLAELPEAIGKASALQRLDLSHNRLSNLPESLIGLSSLEVIFLHGNSELGIPLEVLGPNQAESLSNNKIVPAGDIIDYYFRSRRGLSLNEAKLIVVGRGGVGKTSLVQRLVHDSFDNRAKRTEGIQITQWRLRLFNRETVRLNIWDFGGQEIMHATHQFFLTQRSLYILVLNGREGTEDMDADYWMRLIESFGGNSPVIVVLNKISEYNFDVKRRTLQEKFPSIREFIKTDCQDGTGIEILRSTIERETDRLEDLRAKFPESWFRIKDRLAGMRENYLDIETYRSECAQLGETDADAQNRLAGHLHSLGIVLTFTDDARLRDTHILNPHWVTNGIYKILNAQESAERKGEIDRTLLPKLLDQEVYPLRMHSFLLDLMRKFDLCFPLGDGTGERYLIPDLLDKQEPEETKNLQPELGLNFQYHYPVLPEGLLPRFIVRSYGMSASLPRWRFGVIVQFDGNKAFVKGDAQERRVTISVFGPAPGRRNLLAVIRADFERIHNDIAKLQARAMVPVPSHPNVILDYQKLRTLEQKGICQIQEVVGEDVLSLDVQGLLNGVDFLEGRNLETNQSALGKSVRVFISYAHKDEELRAQLDANLKLFQRTGLIEKWDDRMIMPGEEWRGEIDQNLASADIILLLISADFLSSDFCWNNEMSHALEMHDAGKATVIPVILRDCPWQEASFAKIQVLPKDAMPVTLWRDRDQAWRNVADGIKNAAELIRGRKN